MKTTTQPIPEIMPSIDGRSTLQIVLREHAQWVRRMMEKRGATPEEIADSNAAFNRRFSGILDERPNETRRHVEAVTFAPIDEVA